MKISSSSLSDFTATTHSMLDHGLRALLPPKSQGQSLSNPTIRTRPAFQSDMTFATDMNLNQKRSRDQLSQSSNHAPPTWAASQPEPSSDPHQVHSSPFHFTVPTLRYEGDGFDFRRPVMSTSRQRQEVIDLTGDGSAQPASSFSRISPPQPADRLPRTPPPPPPPVRDVISIDDHDDAAGSHVNASSPELEFMFSRTLLPTTMPYSRAHGAGPGAARPGNPPMRSATNFFPTGDDQPSWAEFRNHGERRRVVSVQEVYRNRQRQHGAFPRGSHGHIHAQLMEEFIHRDLQRDLSRDPMFMHANPNMNLPNINYITQGFAMGSNVEAARGRPPPPTYDPPSPPRAGYTRDPKEEDVLICPNCEQELGVGKDEIKKQVWVIKKCGHV